MAAWFEQDGLTEYTATYRSLSAWRRERDLAAQHGWTTRSRNPRPNKQGVIVIHYHRSASAEARARVEHATTHVAVTRSALPAQEQALREALRQVRADLEAARTDETRDPVALESLVLQSAQRLVRERQALQAAHRTHLGTLSEAEAAHLHARTVRGAKVGDLPEVDPLERSRISGTTDRGDALLQGEQAFQDAQAAVLDAVKEWQKAIGQRWESGYRRARLEEKVAARVAARQAALPALAQSALAQSALAQSARVSSGDSAMAVEVGGSPLEPGAELSSVGGSKSVRASLFFRWRAWQLRRLEGRLADECARLEQLEGQAKVQQQAVVEVLRVRDAAAARLEVN